MEKVRIGFVGVGGMGQAAHLRNYASLPDCEVIALAEVRPQQGQKVALRFGIQGVYTSAAEMLQREKLDALVVPQQFGFHGQIVAPLYQYGLPILTEKPLASSIPTAQKMLAALEAGGSWHMVGYHKRSDLATMWAKAEIERLKAGGELGVLKYVRIAMPPGDWVAGGFHELIGTDESVPPLSPDPRPDDLNEEDFNHYIGFVNYYIHQVNLLRFLVGEDYRVTHADPSGVLLVAQSESGICGTLEMASFQTSVEWHESALVGFERGFVQLELPAPLAHNRAGRVKVLYDDGKTPRFVEPQFPALDAMRNQAHNFVRAVRGEIKPPCEAAEALLDLQVAREYLRLWKGR